MFASFSRGTFTRATYLMCLRHFPKTEKG
uniref:Uncharacterized protein n=1 Tax=Anguilla anguilla TaxID=7936 RepID=A0A0E9XMI0_ANGAN